MVKGEALANHPKGMGALWSKALQLRAAMAEPQFPQLEDGTLAAGSSWEGPTPCGAAVQLLWPLRQGPTRSGGNQAPAHWPAPTTGAAARPKHWHKVWFAFLVLAF